MKRLVVAAMVAACGLGTLSVHAYEIETIQSSGDSTNRVDIVVLGDGYMSTQQDKLTADVHSFLQTFWEASPYGNYREFFNIKLVHVISNEDGADNGSYGATRDTALGAYYNCYDIDRLLCVNSGAVNSVRNSHVPEADFLFIIVNDPKYGGAGGSYSTFSVNEYAGEIAVHEFGHSLGDLADEYEDAYPGYPSCSGDCPEWNATTVTDRGTLKWNIWVEPSTPLPTPKTSPYYDKVGVFEGARYQSVGVYRPKYNCTMRALGAAFCEVCQEGLVVSVYNYVTPLDAKLPANSSVHVLGGDSVQLEVNYPTPVPDTMSFAWSVDSSPISGTGSARVFTALGLGQGTHTVRVDIADETTVVRRDPYNSMNTYATWSLDVDETTDTTNADTDTNPVDTESATVDTGTGTADTGTGTADTGTGTADTGTADTGTGTDQDTDSGEPPLCEPGSKECTGLFEWSVCSADGRQWVPWGACDADEVCENGVCMTADSDTDDDNSSGSDSSCGCSSVGAAVGVSWLELLFSLF